MSVARESINFLPSAISSFFYPLFRKSFPRQTDITRMACFAKSLVRAKAKSDDLSLSPKATSIFFFFVYFFYTYMESLSLSFSHSRYHSLTHSLSFSLSRTSVPILVSSENSILFFFLAINIFRIKNVRKTISIRL